MNKDYNRTHTTTFVTKQWDIKTSVMRNLSMTSYHTELRLSLITVTVMNGYLKKWLKHDMHREHVSGCVT